jgi:signal transduction histidine kinase
MNLAPVKDNQIPYILIVDDESDIRQMASLFFKKIGFRISCAENASEAWQILQHESIDTIITDVMMPGEDGIEFLAKIHDSWPDIPVILMTGYAQLQMAVNAIKNGAFDFIHKPFDFDYLRKVVERAVNYSKLQKIEKNYRSELERTVAMRTAELQKAMRELDAARSALLKSATDKSTFMSTVSHEMRTPMNGVIGSLELLKEVSLTGLAAEYLAMARQSADEMVALIDQMLTFVHSSGQLGLVRYAFVSLCQLLKNLVAEHEPSFKKKGLGLSLHISSDVPENIWTDSDQLMRLLTILVGNALKFTERGGVELHVSRLECEGKENVLLCAVKDSGIGIPEDMLERVFEPFVQCDGSYTRRYEGVGLGLAIARQIALLLGGRLWAERNPDGGSCFLFSMKVVIPEREGTLT